MNPFEHQELGEVIRLLEDTLAVEDGVMPDRAQLLAVEERLRALRNPPPSQTTLWLLEMGKRQAGNFALDVYAGNPDKIGTIKAVRWLTNMGLKEAKDFVESLPRELGSFSSDHPAIKQLEALKAKMEWRVQT